VKRVRKFKPIEKTIRMALNAGLTTNNAERWHGEECITSSFTYDDGTHEMLPKYPHW